jgi:hypothetical protein
MVVFKVGESMLKNRLPLPFPGVGKLDYPSSSVRKESIRLKPLGDEEAQDTPEKPPVWVAQTVWRGMQAATGVASPRYHLSSSGVPIAAAGFRSRPL